ncbi:MAG: glycosyltransferase family 4 protein [Candidatus Tectomicrobia bacterium]|nr:glycosyltransferase family 4 protein [Candidatus Tectomicrobia bacterium]
MIRVLLILDRPGWAFDAIAKALLGNPVGDEVEFGVAYLKDTTRPLAEVSRDYDAYFAMHWSLLADLDPPWYLRRFRSRKPSTVTHLRERFSFLEPSRTITGIHGHHDWDERRTDPGSYVPPPAPLVEFLARYRGVNAVSQRLAQLFREAGLDGVAYTPNGVDHKAFTSVEPLSSSGPLRVCYAGTKKRDWKEGISEFIEPLRQVSWLDVRIAMPEEGCYVPHEKMPRFYNASDVYVCASRSEGFSLAVLEAAACGRPIVTTPVGGCEELIQDGVNGFFIERRLESITARLAELHEDRQLLRRMGAQSRAEIEAKWTWEICAARWHRFIRSSLGLPT